MIIPYTAEMERFEGIQHFGSTLEIRCVMSVRPAEAIEGLVTSTITMRTSDAAQLAMLIARALKPSPPVAQ